MRVAELDLIHEFLAEGYQVLDQLDLDLADLERTPNNRDLISVILDRFQLVRGRSRVLDLHELEAVAATAERLLLQLSPNEPHPNTDVMNGLFTSVDALRDGLGKVEADQTVGGMDIQVMVERSDRAGAIVSSDPAVTDASSTHGEPGSLETDVDDVSRGRLTTDVTTSPSSYAHQRNRVQGGSSNDNQPRSVEVSLPQSDSGNLPQRIRSDGDVLPLRPSHAGVGPSDVTAVPAAQLDGIMGLVGELAQMRNQLLHHVAQQGGGDLHKAARDLDELTNSLYQVVEKTRTQRIGVLFEELASLIAELSYRFSKRLCVLMEGDATEVDTTLLQAIGRPLAHLLRNLVIHGIEAPAVRRAAGKPPQGTIGFRASREGAVLYLEISDDGSGLDPESIRQKTVALGLVSRERAIRMTDSEAITILLGSGIRGPSTADAADGYVGTNAVAALFDQFGGTVELQSRTGQGTTVRLRIPLSLTIMPALLVTARGDRYAVPQPCLRGVVRLDQDQARRDIDPSHDTPVYRRDGRILPLIRLDQELGLAPQRHMESGANIVVIQTGDTSLGVVVDEVLEFQDLVVKPLGRPLNDIGVFAGASAMPDGTTTLVLDPRGLASKSGVRRSEPPRSALELHTRREPARRQESLLLFSSSAGGRFAISLSNVIRIQKIKKATIKRTGDRDVVQYDNEILPLISLEGFIEGFTYGTPSKDTIVVAVYRRSGPSVGLIVDHLLDIVDVDIPSERPTHVDALLGSVVVRGHVTDLIDVDYVVRAQDYVAVCTADRHER